MSDADTLNNEYLPKAVETLGPCSPEIVVVDENVGVIEGDSGHTRTAALKFKDRDEARGWYNSPEYQAIPGLRVNSIKVHAFLDFQSVGPGFELIRARACPVSHANALGIRCARNMQ